MKDKNFGIRLAPELKRAVDIRLREHGISAQALIGGWLKDWLEGKKEAPALPPRDQKWHDMLEVVLRSGQRLGIEYNLEWAVQAVRNEEPIDGTKLDEIVKRKLAG